METSNILETWEILAVPAAPDPKSDACIGEVAGTTTTGGGAELEPHPNEAINRPDFPARVYFNELNADPLNITINYWYHPPAYWSHGARQLDQPPDHGSLQS